MLETMVSKYMVKGFLDCFIGFDFCENCVFGKRNGVKFALGSSIASEILEVIHISVFSYVDMYSIGKS